MKISGITKENKLVIAGVFKMSGTYGLPLDIVLFELRKANLVIDWIDYIKAALKDGMKIPTIKQRILMACREVYGPDYEKEILKRLSLILK